MGVVGVAAFLVIVVSFFANLWWAWRRRVGARTEALLLGLVAAITGVVVGGMFDHYLFNLVYPHMSLLFWMYLGLGMAAVDGVRSRLAAASGPPVGAHLRVDGA
jgi:polysaccharide biosynthesis protein PslJ